MAMKVLTVVGTRPEAIKLAPVVIEMGRRPEVESILCSTGQHLELLEEALASFNLTPDVNLSVMTQNQTLAEVCGRLFPLLDQVVADFEPDWILVQGDTLSVMVASLCAYFRRCKVGHIEAGLRTHDKWQPFPEEVNRRIVSVVSDLNFAPTEFARRNLLNEGVPEESILVTGNTVIDALHLTVRDNQSREISIPEEVQSAIQGDQRLVLITSHRRENFGEGFERICASIREIAEYRPDVRFVFPVHPNPNIRNRVNELLGEVSGLLLTDPLPYGAFVEVLSRADVVLTDSGGIQEEAPGLGKPVVILREVTERPEGLDAGTSVLVGSDRARIVSTVLRLLDSPPQAGDVQAANPFGDGLAAKRIVDALLGEPLQQFSPKGRLGEVRS